MKLYVMCGLLLLASCGGKDEGDKGKDKKGKRDRGGDDGLVRTHAPLMVRAGR